MRAIAHAGGVNSEPLVADYHASHGTPQATTAAGVPEPSAPLRERHRPQWGVALLVALAALGELATYHLVASDPAVSAAAAASPWLRRMGPPAGTRPRPGDRRPIGL